MTKDRPRALQKQFLCFRRLSMPDLTVIMWNQLHSGSTEAGAQSSNPSILTRSFQRAALQRRSGYPWNWAEEYGAAIDRELNVHEFIVQREMPAVPGVFYFAMKIQGTPGLGIGLTEKNEVTDLTPGGAAATDGRLQARRSYCFLPLGRVLRAACGLLLAAVCRCCYLLPLLPLLLLAALAAALAV